MKNTSCLFLSASRRYFLRDFGKDFLSAEYDTIRKRASHHEISAKLSYRAKRLKTDMDTNTELIEAFDVGIDDAALKPIIKDKVGHPLG